MARRRKKGRRSRKARKTKRGLLVQSSNGGAVGRVYRKFSKKLSRLC